MLNLTGHDTIENYEKVLRSLTFTTIDSRPRQDLSGGICDRRTRDPAGESRPTRADGRGSGWRSRTKLLHHYLPRGAPPVPIVDPTGLTIDAAGYDTILSGQIAVADLVGYLAVDTSGTNIHAMSFGPVIQAVRGSTRLPTTSRVLRTATFVTSGPIASMQRVVFHLSPPGRPSLTGEGLITVENPTTVVGQHVFYNHSKYDGYDAGARRRGRRGDRYRQDALLWRRRPGFGDLRHKQRAGHQRHHDRRRRTRTARSRPTISSSASAAIILPMPGRPPRRLARCWCGRARVKAGRIGSK